MGIISAIRTIDRIPPPNAVRSPITTNIPNRLITPVIMLRIPATMGFQVASIAVQLFVRIRSGVGWG
jgi:hypothetical protein